MPLPRGAMLGQLLRRRLPVKRLLANPCTHGYRNVLTGVGCLLFVSVLWLSGRCSGQTYDGFGYSVSGSEITITNYTGPGGAVTVASSIPGVNGTVTSIGEDAFALCGNLTNVTIGNGVTSIGDAAFLTCTNLTSVTIPSGVTNLGGQAFSFCSSLTSAAIPGGVTSIGSGAFEECIGLTNVFISSGVMNIGDQAFEECIGLTSVTIPRSVTNIGWWAFSGCSGLINLTLGNGVTSISGGAFCGCTNLTSVTIPSSVTSIGGGFGRGIVGGAFTGCSGMTNVTIGNGVTSIGVCAFYGCSGLTSVTIPSGVTNIGDWAFYGCSGLTSAYFQGDAPSWFDNQVFNSTAPNFSIYYPSTASGWSTPTWNGYLAQPYDYAPPAHQPIGSLRLSLGTVTPSFNNLQVGTNYLLLVSANLHAWTNSGTAFTATNTSQSCPRSFDVKNSNPLFFRLQVAP